MAYERERVVCERRRDVGGRLLGRMRDESKAIAVSYLRSIVVSIDSSLNLGLAKSSA